MPDPNDPSGPDPDSLAGSPELFATNLLLIRAIDNEIERVLLERESDRITVTLIHPERDYEPETLTEDPSKWSDIVERFEESTHPDKETSADGVRFEPNTPATQRVDEIRLLRENDSLELQIDY